MATAGKGRPSSGPVGAVQDRDVARLDLIGHERPEHAQRRVGGGAREPLERGLGRHREPPDGPGDLHGAAATAAARAAPGARGRRPRTG